MAISFWPIHGKDIFRGRIQEDKSIVFFIFTKKLRMAGIYIHFPFCRQACHYCNFHFSVSVKQKDAYLHALIREIELQHNYFRKEETNGFLSPVDTIYFGGGTPSIMSQGELIRIFEKLSKYFAFDGHTEVTLEANPDDLSLEYLMALQQTPVNRLSIGIQSFHYPDLEYMNRLHSPAQAIQAISNAQKAGFENITADLIYGIPGLSDQLWKENMLRLIRMGVPHISAYALTVEPHTALELFIRRGSAIAVDEEQTARQFEMLQDFTSRYGYQHYEISNFAQPGFLSRHNLSYWDRTPYLGLGPSAHSFKDAQRWWNVSNTTTYIRELEQGRIPSETEVLGVAEQFDEYVMTSLRTMWGCSLAEIEKGWGRDRLEAMLHEAAPFFENAWLVEEEGYLKLTRQGKLFADRIASDLFWSGK